MEPKSIKRGVDLDRAVGMPFEDSYAIFSSMLVHGGGDNHSNGIRFALGFGIIAEKKFAITINSLLMAESSITSIFSSVVDD